MPTLTMFLMRLPVWPFARRAQGGVQNGAIFRGVDLVATEHGLDPPAQAALFGEIDEQSERLLGHAVLRVVEVETAGLGREFLPSRRVGGKKLAEMKTGNLIVVRLQGLPGGSVGQRWCAHA